MSPTDSPMTHIGNLSELVEIPPQGVSSKSALAADGMRVVVFAFDAGQSLSEHSAAVPLMVQVMSGAVEVAAAGDSVSLQPGGMVFLAARTPHSVRASEPSVVQLTLVGRPAPGGAPATT